MTNTSKAFIAASLLLAVMTGGITRADAATTTPAECREVKNLATIIMQKRVEGVSKNKMQVLVAENALAQIMISDAYDQPLTGAVSTKTRVISDYITKWYVGCLANT